MKEIINKNMALLRVSGIGAAAILLLFLVCVPFCRFSINKVWTVIRNHQQVKEGESWAEQKRTWLRKNKELKTRYAAMVLTLPDQNQVSAIIGLLNDRAKESGVEFEALNIKPEQVSGRVIGIPVQIRIRGGYHHVAGFVNAVERGKGIIRVDSVMMKTESILKSEVSAEIVLTICIVKNG